ncbi:hypothetical protein SAMN04487914_108126 [Arthrobacter sp. ok909]|uniref:hypothetical protein n=1 Tax=Arthrobacter sp. ok909 TaxID=1761746 RepID=UPI00088F6BD7|nr:hypothetical protein [Arthrobacter sp. ok909]SDP33916.1 hypothetical protein SAMN04487914_108126 [Arthrobacter sp. ok909]
MSDATDWIGAIGNSIAAIGTAGALLLGVRVYYRQEDDQRRAQASAITVSISEARERRDLVRIELRNDSALPIYGVMLIATARSGSTLGQDLKYTLPPGEAMSFQLVSEHSMSAFAIYQDSAGRRWKRYFTGELTELKKPEASQAEDEATRA